MEEENKDGQEVQETPEGNSEPSTENTEGLSAEEIADLTKRANASSKNFERAKKAEAELKALKPKVEEETSTKEDSNLSQKDVITLAKADIHNDDMDEVIEYAKSKSISISEAMQSNMIKSFLSTQNEERKSAEATSTGGGQKGQEKETPEATYAKAQEGKLPDENDDKGIERLVDGEWDAQSKKANRNR